MNNTAPRNATRLLKALLKKDFYEEIQGDLEELFDENVKVHGLAAARRKYWIEVIKLTRPKLVRNSLFTQKFVSPMLQHNLTLTFRNFLKHKSQFLINVLGLSTGLACVLFIYLWVMDEAGVDKFHTNGDDLYQIMSNHTDASGIHTWKGVPGLLMDEIETSVPEVSTVVSSTDTHEYTLSMEDTFIKGQGKFGSGTFFDVFSYPLKEGNPEGLLNDKSAIVITESFAKKLFRDESPIGQQINWHFWGQSKTVTVRGVLEDIPKSSSEQFDFLLPWDYYHDDLIEFKQWGNYYARIHVVLHPEADKAEVDNKVTEILQEKQNSERVELFLANYGDRYLNSQYENGQQAGGRIEYVRLFTIIALFILFIASINFINLSTAKAAHRVKEIGVKKALGATRGSLISQYLTESIVLGFISLVIALLFVLVLLPQFNFLSQKDISLTFDLRLLGMGGLLILVVGIIAGSYPAFFLSGLKILETIKGKLTRKTGEIWGRNVLVVTQFSLSIILITSVLVVYQQLDFVKNKNLGYDKDNLIYFEREGKLIDNYAAFVAEIKQLEGVDNSAISGFMVGGGNSTGGVRWEGKTPEDQIQFWETRSGYGTLDLLGIEILEGRDFSPDFGIDTAGIILNETAIAAMGMENPLGKKIRHYDGEKTIIGVVKDFNLISLHTKVEPMLFLFTPEETHFIISRLTENATAETIAQIQDLYESFNPGYVFKPQFVDQDYQALYASEDRVATLSQYFAGFAILISCLGLFGLAAFTTERRTKEIGVRKILGSGTLSIVMMLSKDFSKMVIAAILIALPIGYYIVNSWLENFAYTIDLRWWYFAGSAFISLVVAWLTVGLQTFRSARVNPVKSLRDE